LFSVFLFFFLDNTMTKRKSTKEQTTQWPKEKDGFWVFLWYLQILLNSIILKQ
jgi:hypothetical protein